MDIHIRNAIMYGIICKTLYNQAAHCRCACECEKEKDLRENIVKVEMTSTTKSAWVRMVFFLRGESGSARIPHGTSLLNVMPAYSSALAYIYMHIYLYGKCVYCVVL